MINTFLLFNSESSFGDKFQTIILVGLIVIIAMFVLQLITRSEFGRLVLTYTICAFFIACGVICGIRLYKEITAKSYVNGTITLNNQLNRESFYYKSSSVTFYNDLYDEENLNYYSFEVDCFSVEDFDGLKNDYEIKLNKYIIFNSDISAGSILSEVDIDFYNTDGTLKNSAKLNISILFQSNTTKLKLSTYGLEQSKQLEQYFSDYGILLQVDKI